MSIPNWDNTFLSSLWVYRKLRGGCWYLRTYKSYQPIQTTIIVKTTGEVYPLFQQVNEGEAWSRYGGTSPMSYVVRTEDYTPPPKPLPFMAGLGGTLLDGDWDFVNGKKYIGPGKGPRRI